MKMCLGPCTLAVDRELYLSIMRGAVAPLEGQIKALMKTLDSKMKEAAKAEKYEQAAQFRDQMRAIEHITQHQIAILDQTIDAECIGVVEGNGFCLFSSAVFVAEPCLAAMPF